MKKKIIVILVFILIVSVAFGGWRYKTNFLATAVSCAKTATLVNGTGFDSVKIPLPGEVNVGLLTVTFTRTTGSAAKVYFEFQVSFDGGTTWTTNYFIRVEVATNETADTNVVRYSELIALYGCSHIRLFQIVNNDTGVDLTLCNASLSY